MKDLVAVEPFETLRPLTIELTTETFRSGFIHAKRDVRFPLIDKTRIGIQGEEGQDEEGTRMCLPES